MTCLDPRDRADLHAELEWLRRVELAARRVAYCEDDLEDAVVELQKELREGGADR